jgi:hypothetical protein
MPHGRDAHGADDAEGRGVAVAAPYRDRVQASMRLKMLVTLIALAVAPALFIEVVVNLTRTAIDVHPGGLVTEALGGITWSLLVCFGVAAGSALSRMSELAASAVAVVCTPLALFAAKAIQGGLNEYLDGSSSSLPAGLTLIAAVKAVEYGVLAFVLARLANRGVDKLAPHLIAGLATAATFGTMIVLVAATAPQPDLAASAVTTTAIHEFLFPFGCVMAVLLTRTAYPLPQGARSEA